jgi:hypothetical protein
MFFHFLEFVSKNKYMVFVLQLIKLLVMNTSHLDQYKNKNGAGVDL